ncbi:NADH-quinone oxidoreductase subunit B family protein [Campylobacter geochelonis]|uniref:Hydrogenase-4 component I n=1 Tax=Campylobacter geochelonis TaxID=1780362 RepID=A0A128EG05_9BACT|nr:NADH-quinone oxidoreductase subunit B family protein [Campylobacter geochelonis]QKF71927.1 hydrogenase-4, hydrogenase small subunit [Campylobacter geochelonis]CZE47859.1 hydrogenase-4 component I [Campylobacter geochelonis]
MSIYQVPKDISSANDLTAKLEHLKNIKRSFSVYRIDCGSCNGCEIEIFAAITPMWDPERFGFKLVANPRHADILICSGPVTRQMYYPLLRAYEATPDPKIVVAFGACGSSGGIFYDAYSVWGGVDKIIPVDVFIPGCPPHPASVIYGLGMALGIIDQKLKEHSYDNDTTLAPQVKQSIIGNILFERDLQAESKRLMSYVFGRVLFEKYIKAIKSSKDIKDALLTKNALIEAIHKEDDPRYAECMAILHNEIYLKYIKATDEFSIDTQKEIWDKQNDTRF